MSNDCSYCMNWKPNGDWYLNEICKRVFKIKEEKGCVPTTIIISKENYDILVTADNLRGTHTWDGHLLFGCKINVVEQPDIFEVY